jgi:hypothetical protein
LGERRNSYKILVENPEGKRFQINFWEGNIRMDRKYLKEDIPPWSSSGSQTEREGVDWINLTQNGVQWRTLVNIAMNMRLAVKMWIVCL